MLTLKIKIPERALTQYLFVYILVFEGCIKHNTYDLLKRNLAMSQLKIYFLVII